MKRLLITLSILSLSLWALSACSEQVPDDLTPEEVTYFKEKADKAIKDDDKGAMEAVMDELHVRLTGQEPPKGNFDKSLNTSDIPSLPGACNLQKTATLILPKEAFPIPNHLYRMLTYGIIDSGEEIPPFVWEVIECGKSEDNPNSVAMQEALNWAKKLNADNSRTIRKMAVEYAELLIKYPKNKLLETIHSTIIWEAEQKEKDAKKIIEPFTLKSLSEQFHQENLKLWNQARDGNLSAQLNLAERYQDGSKIKKSNMRAYHWFARAEKNGGGETAQKGVKRNKHHLTDTDHYLIKQYFKFNMYPEL